MSWFSTLAIVTITIKVKFQFAHVHVHTAIMLNNHTNPYIESIKTTNTLMLVDTTMTM